MTVFVMTDGCTLLDEFDVSAQITDWADVSATVDIREKTPLRNGGFRSYLPGLVTARTSIAGHADYAAGGVAAEFGVAERGADTLLTLAPQGADTEGDRVIIHRGLIESMQAPQGGVGDIAGFSLNSRGNAAQTVGYVAAPLTSYSTSGLTGTGVNIAGPSADQKVHAALHVTAASGTDLAVKIQSDDNSGFTTATDRITFSTVSAVNSQYLTVDGDLSTETYWRAVITVASGTFTCLCSFGIG